MTEDVMVVGAQGRNVFRGTCYVFDTLDGNFLFKLEAFDGSNFECFENDVAVRCWGIWRWMF